MQQKQAPQQPKQAAKPVQQQPQKPLQQSCELDRLMAMFHKL